MLDSMLSWLIPVVAVIAVIAIVIGILVKWIHTVPASEAKIVSGASKDGKTKVVKPGGRIILIPKFQTMTTISLAQKKIPLTVAGVDAKLVNLSVNATAIIKVGSDEEMIRAASERMQAGDDNNVNGENAGEMDIINNTKDALTGALRAIMAQMTIRDLIQKREDLQKRVLEYAATELKKMGLVIDSFQINDITDRLGYIDALGVPEAEQVKKDAAIAKAVNRKETNDAEVESEMRVAEKNRDRDIILASLDAETKKAQAESNAAGPLAEAERNRQIAIIEQKAAEAQAELREQQLNIEVRKPADAKLYEAEKLAEAEKARQVRKAEADAETTRLNAESGATAKRLTTAADADFTRESAKASAEAFEAKGLADASVTRAKGLAEANAVSEMGLAEAGAMDKKAEAFAKYNDAAILQIVMDKLPEIAREIAAPMSNIDKMTVISTDGASALPKAVLGNMSQLDEMLETYGGGKGISEFIGNFMNKKATDAVTTDVISGNVAD